MRHLKTYRSLVATLLLLGATAAHGTLIFSEDFENRNLGDLDGQAGFEAMDEAQVVSGGLSYSSGNVSVPQGTRNFFVDGPPAANNWVYSNTFSAQTGAVYFSVLMEWTNQTQDAFLFFALSDGVNQDSPLANSGGFYVNQQGTFFGRIRDDSFANTTNESTDISGGQNTSTTQMAVGRLSKDGTTNYNTLDLWINPDSLSEGTPDATVSRDMGISELTTFYFFSGASNQNNQTVSMDNIMIGSSYDSVVIPEPGTLVLLGIALSAVALFGRRRSR
ncbi:MAG: PEP-CTERM sorting domain-containing protein [Verrucomicrobia bacterium]|nr:PEP-CTERM sorting domain-containing protein [Verrucomicrobiota bacterium]MCH8511919.1 PEP-CTERM sorting domain-containing protein [Kiritimatiellia bacterium]